MTDKEMRELDAWIAENVFDLPVDLEAGRRKSGPGYLWFKDGKCDIVKHYSTDPAAAMYLLKKCAEKLRPKGAIVVLHASEDDIKFWAVRQYGGDAQGNAETLELAIAKFAKALFEAAKKGNNADR